MEHYSSTLALQDVSYTVKYRRGPWWQGSCFWKRHEKQLLNKVSFTCSAGQLVGLLGSSGSGKTCLLNVIACRVYGGTLTGVVKYKGMFCTHAFMQQRCSYVIQADRLLPSLTVREMLTYAAYLRLPGKTVKKQINQKVDSVITKMGLWSVADSRVGGSVNRGISGGEKRRVTIALQLLQDPDILLLDEPTTGLDSFTARHLVANLQEMAHQGKLVIMSIHQPRSDIAQMLDQVALLCRGELVYFGPTVQLIPYFTALGYHCPPHSCPLDIYMDLASIDHRCLDVSEASSKRLRDLIENFRKSELFINIRRRIREQMVRSSYIMIIRRYNNAPPSCFRVFTTILCRFNVSLFHERWSFLCRILLLPAFVVAIITFLGRLGNSQKSIQDRIGLLYQSVQAPAYVGIINAIALFPTLRNHFYREKQDGLYSSAAFLLAYSVHIMPFAVVTSVIFSSFLYWVCGLNPDLQKFGMFTIVVVCLYLCGEFVTVAILGIFQKPQLANLISFTLATASGLLASGFLRSIEKMLKILKYLTWLSIHKYTSEILATNEFQGLNLTCIGQVNGLPCIPMGDIFLRANYPGAENNTERNFLAAAIYVVAVFLIANIIFISTRNYRILH